MKAYKVGEKYEEFIGPEGTQFNITPLCLGFKSIMLGIIMK